MDTRRKAFWAVVLVLVLAGGTWLATTRGCEETAQAVDAVGDEVTGRRALRQGQELEAQARRLGDLQSDRLRQMEAPSSD